MAALTCKMCGGNLVLTADSNVCECEFCGTRQTVPNADNEKKTTLFNEANRLRMNAEFDKAAAVYESIVAEFPEEAEAYWGLCLCTYGIEYVDDPATGEKKPTCHRTMPLSIMEDSNFEQACDCADVVARRVYRDEAKAIDRIQKDILSIVSNEAPYDVFICYKETSEEGSRTEDSVLAQDIYDALTAKGLKVFFSRITLEDKLGQQYEPYIYAALASAKVMVAVGTQYEYYDAVWVKNEWMRFLAMMKNDRTKTLIPCFKDLDAYDMPKEFKQLQAQDMGKLGWLQDLTRGILKLCGKENGTVGNSAEHGPQSVVQQTVIGGNPTAVGLLQRAKLFLEDQKWEEADQYAERVLDIEPMNAEAYLVKLMAELNVSKEEALAEQKMPFGQYDNYQKAVRFADEARKQQIKALNEKVEQRYREEKERAENARKTAVLEKAKTALKAAESLEECQAVTDMLGSIAGFAGVTDIMAGCTAKAAEIEAVNARIATMETELKEQQERYQQASEKAMVIHRQLQDTEKDRDRIAALLKNAENELSNLRGLFTGKKRAELEAVIATKSKELANVEDQLAKEQYAYQTAQNGIPEQPNETEVKYIIANEYMQAGLYRKAYKRYKQIVGYKDVESLLKDDDNLAAAVAAAQEAKRASYRNVGGYAVFGSYPQTADGVDSTPIEWLVLDYDAEKDCALLISRYGLDAQPYNKEWTSITWEQCTLRTWLNDTFLNKAFTAQEQTGILVTNVDNSSSQGYSKWSTSGGNNTQDRIFLLSYAEANKYLDVTHDNSNNMKSRVAPTNYAKKQGAVTCSDDKTADGAAAGQWWLRSPGYYQSHAALVFCVGSLVNSNASDENGCVRPALWINLESDIF